MTLREHSTEHGEDQLNKRLDGIHEDIRAWLSNINRISVALYDPETGILKTFINGRLFNCILDSPDRRTPNAND